MPFVCKSVNVLAANNPIRQKSQNMK